jgi:serine/threonine protein kinase
MNGAALTGRVFETTLVLPYESMRTIYNGVSEVRLYKNTLIDSRQVGKRIDTLGLEASIAVLEAQVLRELTHPNLVHIVDVVAVEDSRYPEPMKLIEMIMPYYERGSICDAFGRGDRFSLLDACRHAQAALRGLGELHEGMGILHRDVKSPNIFLSDDSHLVKVGDLGIAVRMNECGEAESYPTAQVYTPPEAFPTHLHDRRSDIYGLGLLLFEMANGPLPYDHISLTDVATRLNKGLRSLPDRDLAFQPYVPSGLRRVIRKAISRRPADRYPFAHSMSAAISRVPMIDWRQVQSDSNLLVWEGSRAASRRTWRVQASLRKGGTWRLSGLQHKNRWQRAIPDQDVAQLAGKEADAFFDQLLTKSAAV